MRAGSRLLVAVVALTTSVAGLEIARNAVIDTTHPIFETIDACEKQNAVHLDFTKGFQQYSNLGGMGPDDGKTEETGKVYTRSPHPGKYNYPRAIRYANVASGVRGVRPDAMVGFFCGTLPAAFKADLWRWQDGVTPRACDPYESPKNYKQFEWKAPGGELNLFDGEEMISTGRYFSDQHMFEYHHSNLAAVAWSGRMADSPPNADGRTLNKGVLEGTTDSFDSNGEAVG